MDLDGLYFSGKGRIGRATWWMGSIGLVIANVVATGIAYFIFKWGIVFTLPGRLIALAIAVVTMVAGYFLAAKRFQDRDRPALLAQLVLAFWAIKAVLDLFRITGDPFAQNWIDKGFWFGALAIGLWYFVELGCLRGTVGANQYGEDPLANDGAASAP